MTFTTGAYRSDSVISSSVFHVSNPSETNDSRYWERPSRSNRSLRSVMKRWVGSLITLRVNHGAKGASKKRNKASILGPAETIVVNKPPVNGKNKIIKG
jgi:hypothetical protein